MQKFLFIILIVLFGVGVFFLFSNNGQNVSETNSKAKVTPVNTVQKPNTILIEKYAYGPGKITIKRGTTITWVNQDIAKHTVTVDEESKEGPKSEFFGKGESYSYTFKEVGQYPYHCEPHPYMTGMVEVVE